VFGVNLGHLWDQVPRIRGWADDLLALWDKGVVRPHVDKVFPFAEAAAAHHYVQDRKNIGKVLLKP
jgi:NADPH:quinone reductase-like Zn-dependent oxidoreductase